MEVRQGTSETGRETRDRRPQRMRYPERAEPGGLSSAEGHCSPAALGESVHVAPMPVPHPTPATLPELSSQLLPRR